MTLALLQARPIALLAVFLLCQEQADILEAKHLVIEHAMRLEARNDLRVVWA